MAAMTVAIVSHARRAPMTRASFSRRAPCPPIVRPSAWVGDDAIPPGGETYVDGKGRKWFLLQLPDGVSAMSDEAHAVLKGSDRADAIRKIDALSTGLPLYAYLAGAAVLLGAAYLVVR